MRRATAAIRVSALSDQLMDWQKTTVYPDEMLHPGMVLGAESYIGAVGGREGVELEQQVLITETDPELFSKFPFEAGLLR